MLQRFRHLVAHRPLSSRDFRPASSPSFLCYPSFSSACFPTLVFLLILGLWFFAAPVGAQPDTAQPFTARDLVTLKRLSDPQVAPDGSGVVYVLRETDLEANRGRTDLWWVSLEDGASRRLTSDPAGDSSPRWAADGSGVFFLSSRSGSSQVWFLPLPDGEPRQITDLPLDVGNLVVAPSGDKLAVTLEVFEDCETLACTAERLAAQDEDAVTGQLYDSLFVRHWDVWKDGRRSHLFVLPLKGGTAGKAVDVTRRLGADVPSKPFGGAEEIAFAADGRELVFTARQAGREEPWSTDFDLFRVAADGSGAPVELTADNDAWDTAPVFSPDGSTLAYLAMARPGFEADRFRVVVRAWPDGEPRVLTEDWDRSAGSLTFSPDGRTLWVTAADLGQVSLFAVDVARGDVRRVFADGHVRSPRVIPAGETGGERLLFGRDTLDRPVDLYTLPVDAMADDASAADAAAGHPSGLERLTAVNDEHLARVTLGTFEQFTFEGAEGDTVHAYVVRPAGFRAGETYPVAFLVHGGPQGSFGNDFHYRWNPQTYAGAGFAVVMVDFHGSVGYGQDFTDAIRGDWGGKPLEDLKKGLAAAVERYPWLDAERSCALGASYGGYMINWIAGKWSDGFRCLVNHDGIFDQRMMYYATEELWFPEWEHGGPYFANPEGYERHNPARHVEDWRTPMLVIHGALDYRVPLTQGLATFTALQRRGVESQFLYFPDENHWVLSPANSVLWHETVHDWLKRWLRR